MGEFYFPYRQSILIIICGTILLVTVINLIRKRKLLEQYGILWIGIGVLSVFALWLYPALLWFTEFIGAGSTTSAMLFASVFILLLISIQLSMKISEYAYKIKDIIQHMSILQLEVQNLRQSLEELKKEKHLNASAPDTSTTDTEVQDRTPVSVSQEEHSSRG